MGAYIYFSRFVDIFRIFSPWAYPVRERARLLLSCPRSRFIEFEQSGSVQRDKLQQPRVPGGRQPVGDRVRLLRRSREHDDRKPEVLLRHRGQRRGQPEALPRLEVVGLPRRK